MRCWCRLRKPEQTSSSPRKKRSGEDTRDIFRIQMDTYGKWHGIRPGKSRINPERRGSGISKKRNGKLLRRTSTTAFVRLAVCIYLCQPGDCIRYPVAGVDAHRKRSECRDGGLCD